MLRHCTSSCPASHTWCYDATLLYVFLHCLTYMMLRYCTSSCTSAYMMLRYFTSSWTSSHTWCYATPCLLALPHIHDATPLYVVLHCLTYMMRHDRRAGLPLLVWAVNDEQRYLPHHKPFFVPSIFDFSNLRQKQIFLSFRVPCHFTVWVVEPSVLCTGETWLNSIRRNLTSKRCDGLHWWNIAVSIRGSLTSKRLNALCWWNMAMSIKGRYRLQKTKSKHQTGLTRASTRTRTRPHAHTHRQTHTHTNKQTNTHTHTEKMHSA